MHLRFGFFLLTLICNIFIGYSQPLSSVLPKNGAFTEKNCVHFEWNKWNSAIDYTIELAQNEDFTIGLQQFDLITSTTWQSPTLSNGEWFWRVIGNTGTQLDTSEAQSFRIFQPNNIQGNTLWLAADSNVLLDGAGVASWNDLSGNENNFSQPNTSEQPIVSISTELNNQKVLTFDGVNDFLNGGDILDIGTNDFTSFYLAKGTGSYYAKFGSAPTPHNIYGCYNIGAEQGHEFAGTTYQNFFTTNSTNYHVISFLANRTTAIAKLFRNFNQVSGGQINAASVGYDFNTTNPMLIGRYSFTFTPFFLNGQIGEIIFYNVALSDVDRQLVQNHLIYKYAPPVNLGKDTLLTNFCELPISPGTNYTNYMWSTGETSPTINVSMPGEYWVRATNVFGVVSSDTIQIAFPSFNIPEITGICTDGSVMWDADLGPGFTYEWSTAETSPSILITTAGDYSVEITDAFLCSMTSDVITFTDDDYSETMSLGADVNLCIGNFISLEVGAEETVSYSWPTFTPSHQAEYHVTFSGDYFVETINVNGCVAQDTISVTIVGVVPTAQFSSENVCFGLNSQFSDVSSQSGSEVIISWEWDFGDGTNEFIQNPTHSYTNAGEYEVVLTILADNGCQSTSSQVYTVYSLPEANFSYSEACSDQEVQFNNQSTIGSGEIDQFLWNFDLLNGGSQVSLGEDPLVLFDEVRNYTVELTIVDENACEASHQQLITVQQSPNANFEIDLACANTVLPIENLSSSTESPTYLWNFDDGTTSGLSIPSKNYTDIGAYSISLLVTNSNGCADSTLSIVNVYATPVSSLTKGPVCEGSYAEFSATSTIVGGTISDYLWEFNNLTNLVGDTVYHLIDVMGQNQVELTTISEEGCSHTLSQFFDVSDQLVASFTTPLAFHPVGYPVQFLNTSVGDFDSFWDFGTTATSNETSPTYIFQQADTTFTISLILMNDLGCVDTSSMNILISPVIVDLEISSMYFQNSSSGKVVGVEMKNLGTLTITSAEMNLLAREGLLLSELWTGELAPLESEIYLFPQAVTIENSEEELENYLCVDGAGYGIGGVSETNFENNRACKNAEGSQVVLTTIYPNPATESVTLQLIVPVTLSVDLGIYDTRGRLIVPILTSKELALGMHSFTIPTNQIGSGMYFIRLKSGDVTNQQKLMILGE